MNFFTIFNKTNNTSPKCFNKIGALNQKFMLENFLKFAETEKLTKAQQKTITGGETPEEEAIRKGKVAA